MCPTDVEINDVARLLVQLVNLLFVLLPALLISLQLLILMLSLLSELRLLSAYHVTFSLQLAALSPEQVLEPEHELLKKSINRRTFTLLEVLNHVLLLIRCHHLWAKMLLLRTQTGIRLLLLAISMLLLLLIIGSDRIVQLLNARRIVTIDLQL